MSDSDVVVQASHVAFRWGVVDVDLALRKGRITGFLGKNGAGKSTTMKLLAGVLVPSSGSVVVDGVAADSAVARAKIGWAPEEPAVHPALTVREQMKFAAQLRCVGAARDVDEALGALDLRSVEMKTCGTLSKGTRQRLGVAMALLGRPTVLLLDEPTSGLDPSQVVNLRALLLRRRDDGVAILLSSHVTAEIAAVADDVTAIRDGRTVHAGSKDTLDIAIAGAVA